MRSVSAHSSATGRSLVPALTSATGRVPSGGIGALLERRGARELDVAQLWQRRAALARLVRVEPRDEDVLARAGQLARDAHDLRGRLSLAEHDLGRTLPERAVVIDGRVAEVRERQVLELRDRVVDARRAAPHSLEQLPDPCGVHDRRERSIVETGRVPPSWNVSASGAPRSPRSGHRNASPARPYSALAVPIAFAPFFGLALGAALAWIAAAELARDDGPIVASRSFAIVAAFAGLVWVPVVGYFVAFHGDWSYLYVVPWRRVPGAVDLGLVLLAGAAVVGSFWLAVEPVRRRRFGPVVAAIVAPTRDRASPA